MESDVQRKVTHYLDLSAVRWARNNAGARGHVKFGLRLPEPVGIDSGGPDLVVFPRGLPVVVVRSVADMRRALRAFPDTTFGVELKDQAKLSPSQRDWIAYMEPR